MANRLVLLAVLLPFLAFAMAVLVPEDKLYFSIPLPAAPAPPAPVAPPPPPPPAGNTSNTTSNTTAPAGAVLNFIPLGQVLANIFQGVFGTLNPGALNVSPIGAVLGYVFGKIFGIGWTPSG